MGTGKTYSTKYLLDSNNSSGVAGQVLVTTATGVSWQDAESTGNNQTQGSLFDSKIILIDTPNGGLKPYRVITDEYGEWIQVGRFAANAQNTIQASSWSSVSGLSTGTSQGETTQFSADFGDCFPDEVRIMGATDFNNWRNTRTIDFVYKVPAGRKWKHFFSNGSTTGMGIVDGVKYGWTVNGAYDGFGRWTNSSLTSIRMSDFGTAPTNPPAAFTTATANAFYWNPQSDAKFSVSATRTFCGQDTFVTSGVGIDDSIAGFFDSYPSEVTNMQGGAIFSSAIWILIKVPGGASGGGGDDVYWSESGNDIHNDNTGNVGIGVTDPQAKLEVKGTSAGPADGNEIISVTNTTGNTKLLLGVVENFYGWIQSAEGSTYRDLLLNPLGGNVGIGTDSPRGKLDIVGNTDNDADFLTIQDNDTSAGSHRPSVRFRSDTAQIGQIVGLNGSMRFSSGSTENSMIEILDNGNVGIGNTSPTNKLHIQGSQATVYSPTDSGGQASAGTTINNTNTAGNTNNFSQLLFTVGTNNNSVSRIVAIRSGSDASDLAFVGKSAAGVAEYMRIKSGGDVGIGTDSPANKLDVKISTSNRTTLEPVMSVSAEGSGPYTGFGPKISFSSNIYYGAATGNPAGIIETAYIGAVMGTTYATNSDLVFATRDGATSVTEKMRILGNGNVGIGVTSPERILHLDADQGQPIIQLDKGGDKIISMGTGSSATGADDTIFQMFNEGTELVRIFTEGNSWFNGGNVGIGVTSPSSKLTIETNAGDGTIELLAVNAATTKNKIIFSEAVLGDESFFIEHDGAGAGADNLLKIHGDGSGGTASGITIRRSGLVGVGTDSPGAKLEVAGNITTPTQELSNTATPTNFGVYSSEIRLIDTPNGGLKQCRVITDNYGEWILVGRFAADAMSTIQNTWSSESGLDTSTSQSTTTKFSADFGDSYPTEVRIMGATDFNKWRDTRTIDFVYGVPEGRKWKNFFSGGTDNGMALSGKYGWGINGAYDGFGRWVNPAQNFVRMSDGNVTNPSAAYTTATANAFNWEGAADAKITVSATRVFSGQDTFVTAGFGNDDGIQGFFDEYPNETNNMQGGLDFSSAVWVLIKLPTALSSGSGSGAGNQWAGGPDDIHNTNTGNVGIGIDDPLSKLQVDDTSDGDKIRWSRSGTLIGSLGTYNGVPYIGYQGGAGGGIMFNGSSIEPTALGSSRTSNANDVGSPNYKWRNGYFGNAVSAATYTAAAAEGLRINDSAAYISGYNTAGTQRTGYIQFLHASGTILIDSELGSRYTVMALASASAVGIGTSLPDEKLTVNGITRAVDPIYFGAINTDNGTYGPYIESSDDKGLKFDFNGNNGGEFQIWNHDANGGGATEVFTIEQDNDIFMPSGNVTIGKTTAALGKLDVSGTLVMSVNTTARFKTFYTGGFTFINGGVSGNDIYFGAPTNYTQNIRVQGTGIFNSTVTATNFILSSDKTLKENVKDIDTKHIDVNWKNFELKSEPGVKRSGVIAQELEKKHPEFVRTNEDGLKSVAYIDLLIAKIAELEARLEKAGI